MWIEFIYEFIWVFLLKVWSVSIPIVDIKMIENMIIMKFKV